MIHFDNPPFSDRAQARFVKSKDLTLRLTIFGQSASTICQIKRSDPTPQSVKNEDLTPFFVTSQLLAISHQL